MAPFDAIPYGQRLFPTYLDEVARTNPGRVYASIPKTADVKDGFLDVTIADLARCANFMAKWIEDNFGKSDNFETITYLGLSDLRGVALFFGAMKTGHKLLLVSPRNPPATNTSLMEQTGSHTFLFPSEIMPLVEPFRSVAPPSCRLDMVPSFLDMLQSMPEHYPYAKEFEEARDDPILILPSSGSTGLPKPIVYTHGTFAAHDMEHILPAPPGRVKRDISFFEFQEEARLYLMFPLFHLAGFIFYTFHSIFNTLTIVIGPAHVPPHVDLMLDILKQQNLRGLMVSPAMMEQLLQKPEGFDIFKNRLEFVVSGGAPIPPALGDTLAPIVNLMEFYGSTETLPFPELFKDPADYLYHEFNPNLKFEMQLYSADEGTFEMVIFANEANRDTIPFCHNFPGVEVYHTRDLFTRHPTKENLYKYFGRKDDILVLINGEKVNPIPLELAVQGHHLLQGALLVGMGRNQTALLIEPRDSSLDAKEREKLLREVWSDIEKANAVVPGAGRVARDKVICATADRPLVRTGKGTIIRSSTEKLYAQDLEALFSEKPSRQFPDISLEATVVKTTFERTKIISFLRRVFSLSYTPGATIGEDDDFFSHGLDSIQTLEITRNLRETLKGQTSMSMAWMTPRMIFQNPTLSDLGSLLGAFLNDGVVPDLDEKSQTNIVRAVNEAVGRQLAGLNLSRRVTTEQVAPKSNSTVAVIGTTGYLGRYLLEILLKDAKISRIFCLNRGADAEDRQIKSLLSLDKNLAPLFNKLTFLKIQISEPLFGLSQLDYELLGREVDVIVYNSWKLDFGLSIRSFEPFLKASRELIELSAGSKTNMHIVFVSSISSVMKLAMETVAPEEPIADPMAAIGIGYGQAKLAVERIFVAANKEYGIPVSIARVGQVGGPSPTTAGAWADQPWISALARTSKSLGVIPTSVAMIDWLPVDTIAAMLHVLIVRPAEKDVQVYNLVSYDAQPWDLFVTVLQKNLGVGDTINLSEWVSRLQAIKEPNSEDAERFPALKMLSLYEALIKGHGHTKFSTDRIQVVSEVEAPALTMDLLSTWIKDWNF